jgi:uncharacterized membrane protein YdbT with pleckstrin-like domain
MSYVASVLQPGERIIRLGSLHWIVYRYAILFAVLAILCTPWAATDGLGVVPLFCAMAFGVLAVLAFGVAWFKRWTTEIAITDRRIIYKDGFINRHTVEMNMDKVASVDVSQSILGRLLDYGSIRVGGIGGAQSPNNSDASRTRSDRASGIERLERVAQPLALRSAITAK